MNLKFVGYFSFDRPSNHKLPELYTCLYKFLQKILDLQEYKKNLSFGKESLTLFIEILIKIVYIYKIWVNYNDTKSNGSSIPSLVQG